MIVKNNKKRLTLIKTDFYWYIVHFISAYDEVITQKQIAQSEKDNMGVISLDHVLYLADQNKQKTNSYIH